MRNFLPIIVNLDVTPLVLAIQRQPWLWNRDNERTEDDTSPHKDVDDIWIRYNHPSKKGTPEFHKRHTSVWYPAYYNLPQIRDIVFPLMHRVEGEQLGGVLITRIPPGKSVAEHADDNWHVQYYDKYYVQLQSHPQQVFYCGDDAYSAKPGDVYHFDNTKVHRVENNSDCDRMTLIICIRSNRREHA